MKRNVLLIVLLAVLLVSTGELSGQENPPLILLANNELWLVDDTSITSLTPGNHVYEAALSPDGTRIAYNAYSPISIEALERTGGIGGGPLPADITIMDLASLKNSSIATQPDDASFFIEDVPDSALLRSAPTWSPDGTHLAWGEIHYPSYAPETNQIIIYDLVQDTSEVLVTNLPDQAGITMPVAPRWGDGGIAIASYEYNAGSSTFHTRILVYDDQDGSLISTTPISEDDTEQFGSFRWVQSNGQPYIAIEVGRGPTYKLLDPQTGVLTPAYDLPALYNPLIPDSAAVRFAAHDDAQWPEFYSWILVYPDGQQIESAGRIASTSSIALGPDGLTFAEVSSDGILSIFLPDGQRLESQALEDRFSIPFWGLSRWRVGQAEACGTAPIPRLVVGWSGHVLPNTTPNNVRSEPSTGDVIGQLRPGDRFTILAGPVCVDGLYWWQVDDYNGLVGWTAEGDSGTYWLEPEQG